MRDNVEAVIGQPFTFTVLFVNATEVPIVVTSPTVTIYDFSATGTKQTLISAALSEAVPVEVGRYTYTYTIPTTFTDGDPLYGLMEGVDPGTGQTIRTEQSLTLISSNRGLGGYSGLTARFVE
jgi:hypothetical protein